jgi:lipopolysaccharide export system protein LptA
VVSGTVIVYNSLTDVFTVDGTPQGGGGRVRATLTPRSGASAPAPRNGLPLRGDDRLGGRNP